MLALAFYSDDKVSFAITLKDVKRQKVFIRSREFEAVWWKRRGEGLRGSVVQCKLKTKLRWKILITAFSCISSLIRLVGEVVRADGRT